MFQRAEQLLGTDAMKRIGAQRVIIFGVGGVGSWCAEALVRTGIQHLTLVDFDRVDVSNINRLQRYLYCLMKRVLPASDWKTTISLLMPLTR